jgi:hypothetical protein
MFHPSAGSEKKPIKEPPNSFASYLGHAGFLLDLFFDFDDGDKIFLRNVRCPSADHTAFHPRR